jgi:hypothetical protein
MPVLVDKELQYFSDNQQAGTMPFLSAGHAHPGTEVVSVWLGTFVPCFLAAYILAERRSPKAMLHLIVPVLLQQDLLL